MMTLKEYECILRAMPEAELNKFKLESGGDPRKPIEWFVSDFQHRPEHEVGLCRRLGVLTEKEKESAAAELALQATLGGHDEAKKANKLAEESNRISHSANTLSEKAIKTSEEANSLSATSNDIARAANNLAQQAIANAKTANWVAFGAMLMSAISAVIAAWALYH